MRKVFFFLSYWKNFYETQVLTTVLFPEPASTAAPPHPHGLSVLAFFPPHFWGGGGKTVLSKQKVLPKVFGNEAGF